MANRYDKGDLVRISAIFTVAGTNTDPTTVTLKVKDPSGNTATYTYGAAEITKDATGQYHKDITIDEGGVWPYRWEATGAVVTAGESYLLASAGNF